MPDSSSTDAAATDITRRFGVILEAMLTVGFQDFDEVAAAYYTAEFEKGSFLASKCDFFRNDESQRFKVLKVVVY